MVGFGMWSQSAIQANGTRAATIENDERTQKSSW